MNRKKEYMVVGNMVSLPQLANMIQAGSVGGALKTYLLDDWLYEPGRSPVFQKWMDSLKDKRVKHLSDNMPNPNAIAYRK